MVPPRLSARAEAAATRAVSEVPASTWLPVYEITPVAAVPLPIPILLPSLPEMELAVALVISELAKTPNDALEPILSTGIAAALADARPEISKAPEARMVTPNSAVKTLFFDCFIIFSFPY